MTGKKTLIRNLLFAAVATAVGIFCTGCFTSMTLDELGSTKSFIAGEHYEFSPSRDEIVFSCRKEKKYNYIPFLHPFGVAPKKTVQTYEKHIPLNPVPDHLMHIELNVIPDASAARAESSPSIGAGGGFRASDGVTMFPMPTKLIRGNADSTVPPPILSAGDTLELRAHPDDLHLLSEPFVLSLDNLSIVATGPSAISNINADKAQDNNYYDLMGRKYESRTNLPAGIYIHAGKKVIVK
jgi:hypothetical protein